MPITLAGSARRRVVERETGVVGVAGSAAGPIERGRAVGRETGAAGAAGSAQGSATVAGRRVCAAPSEGVVGAAGLGVGRETGAAGAAGSAQGSATVAGRRVCAAPSGGVVGATGLGNAAGGGAFARAARAAGLSASKGGGSVGFLTWSDDEVESAGPTAFTGGEIGLPLCA